MSPLVANIAPAHEHRSLRKASAREGDERDLPAPTDLRTRERRAEELEERGPHQPVGSAKHRSELTDEVAPDGERAEDERRESRDPSEKDRSEPGEGRGKRDEQRGGERETPRVESHPREDRTQGGGKRADGTEEGDADDKQGGALEHDGRAPDARREDRREATLRFLGAPGTNAFDRVPDHGEVEQTQEHQSKESLVRSGNESPDSRARPSTRAPGNPRRRGRSWRGRRPEARW
ncbi:MAG: hypothetical protein EXR61_03435, partial [Chloroflexi bacterium]|nr:hypothetical protein [Chloroflexota bacterium]